MSVNINPTKWFQLSANINASWSEQDYGMSTLKGQSSSVPDAIYGAAKAIYNYAVPYDDNGELIMQPGGGIQNTVIGETENPHNNLKPCVHWPISQRLWILEKCGAH